ncbi:VWA domain-containing protein [Nitrospirillum sp. BR 11828]|uniref:vWA domain-containing protein n=1 Tax=Nitrospirillum sp. BR 11828 TaxID=3104325 RepID=UPI002ACA242E|nr:VWA domain-containing protein [Nitrospirillum sp. BR 11828]MDZ5648165.1 VWA domain-containing protein [Nitrospirillum sp. BR 11828]
MFTTFFFQLRQARIPVTLREYLALMEAMSAHVAGYSVEDFYHLSRTILVKDERNLDRFDLVFGQVFKGLEGTAGGEGADIAARDLPEEWLRKLAERHLTDEEKAQIQALGGWDRLMETLAQRLKEQQGRHQGGSKWIGTAGTSPFGAYGYNPEGVRIGQEGSRHRRAVKVWDRREFRNLDDTVELGTRNIKVALRRLRKFARTGAAEVLDLPDTIRATAANAGHLDLKLRPERHNAVKVLLFLDVGGSMDDHIRLCEELFSAAKGEFKHLEYFYFHNCVYEGVWKDNRRRRTEQMSTVDVLHTYPADYKLIFVGDASMSPYEITHPGGAVEHWNAEAGQVWLRRLLDVYRRAIWLNPVQEGHWPYTASIGLIKNLMEGRMYPLTLQGLEAGMRELSY